MIRSWSTAGSDGQPILGNTHLTPHQPRGVILICHGFKGYKDYGMFPRLAAECAHAGFVGHRFNFSHSGMTNNLATFERPDLFERDTWNKQVFDLRAVIQAMQRGDIAGRELPYIIFGHSRGGVTALLTAGRWADERPFPQPAGVITAAAPASCNPFSPEETSPLLQQGYLESPSSRTGQILRISRAFLQEQIDDPDGHDLLRQIARIRCPLLIIHGDRDPTVPAECAQTIARAAKSAAEVQIIAGADHVFNTPNPFPLEGARNESLARLVRQILAFAARVCPPRFRFEWDDNKNQANIAKHHLDFHNAAELFAGPRITLYDNRREYGEDRWIAIGTIGRRTLVAVYTLPAEDTIRLISLRKATRHEREAYERAIQNRLEQS